MIGMIFAIIEWALDINWIFWDVLSFSPVSNVVSIKNVGYQFGVVHLRGLVKSGTVGLAIFNLPEGYRPSAREAIATISNGAIGRCDIKTSGNVIAYIGNNAWFSLDGITFRADGY